MKILIVTTISGTMNFFKNQIEELISDGYEVHLATNFKVGEISYSTENIVTHQIDFSRSIRSSENIKAYKQLKVLLKQNEYDVIHTHTPIASALIRLQKKHINCKVVYTAHGFHFYKGAPIKNWLLYYPIEKILSNRTDVLITINKEDYYLAKKKFKQPQVYLLDGPGVNFRQIDQKKAISRENLGLKNSDFIIIFGAELNKNKNQKLLIDSIEILQKKYKFVKLLLVGKDNFNGYYQEYTKEKYLQNNVIFLGRRNDIIELIKMSDLAVSSSLREGLGLFLIESAYCGLPLIATDNRGSREIIDNGHNGFLSNFEKNKLANLIEEFIIDDQMRSKLSENARISVDRFSVDNVNERLKKIYEQ